MCCHFQGKGHPLLLTMLMVLILLTTHPPAAAADLHQAEEETEQMDAQALPDFLSMWDFSDPAATELKFREILPQAEASGDILYHIELLTQIARTEGLQSKFTEAHRTLDRVAGMLASGDENSLLKGRLRYLLERGRAYNSAGKPEEAQPLFHKAWELGTGTSYDNLAIDAAHMLGIVTKDQESLDWNLLALQLARESDDPKAVEWQGSLYNNIGWTYMERKQPEKALEMWLLGVEFRETNDHSEESRSVAHWTVARALRELGRHDEAFAKLREIDEMFPKSSEDGFWHEEMGENLLATGQTEEGLAALRTALPMLLALGWVEKWEPERIARLKELTGWVEPAADDGTASGDDQ